MERIFLLRLYYFKNYASSAASVFKLASETDPLRSVNGYWDSTETLCFSFCFPSQAI